MSLYGESACPVFHKFSIIFEKIYQLELVYEENYMGKFMLQMLLGKQATLE